MKTSLFLVLATMASVGIGSIGSRTAESAKPKFRRIPSSGVTFKKKAGYWTECRYSGLGTICETVHAKARNGKFRKLRANEGKLKRKADQVLVCYKGSHNAEVCYWTCTPRKA
jgi:hypothetical protein